MQRNGRISNLELAEQVGLSPTPCSRRVKRLEASGIIDRHVTLLNPQVLNLDLTALIGIEMDRHTPDRFAGFEAAIADFETAARNLEVAAAGSDPSAVGPAMKALGKTCGDCHDAFRKPEEESFKKKGQNDDDDDDHDDH